MSTTTERINVSALSSVDASVVRPSSLRIAFAFEGAIPSPQADVEVFTQTAAALARRGHNVSLSFASGQGRTWSPDERLGASVIDSSLRFEPVYNPFAQTTAQHGFQALRVPFTKPFRASDVVYTRNVAIVASALRAGALVFFDFYRPLADQVPLLQPLLRRWMTHPRFLGMACHSELARRSYLRIGVPSDRLEVVYTGFDPARMQPEMSKEQARGELGWDPRRPTVVYTGRVNEKKGLETVLATAQTLPEVDFVLVGAAGDGNAVETEAERLANVRLVSWQSPRATTPYLYAADVLIIPPSSRPLEVVGRTVLPLKVFLYLAAGRPVLAGDTPDLREVLTHGQNAWLVSPGSVAEAAEGVRRLCGDTRLAEKLSTQAKADVTGFTWDARAARLEAFINQRLQAPRAREVASGWSFTKWVSQSFRRPA